jgi:hypothetical protein
LRNDRKPVSGPAEFPHLLNSEPVEREVLQPVFLLKRARVAQAGLADVDRRDKRVRLAQRVNGGLRGSAAGDKDRAIRARRFG